MDRACKCPNSELSLNVVKMLTQVQAVPLLAIDVLAHPALLGYTVEKSGKPPYTTFVPPWTLRCVTTMPS